MKLMLFLLVSTACVCSAAQRLEAENAVLDESTELVRAEGSSGGAHILLRHPTRVDDPSSVAPSAVFTFTVPDDGRYYLRLHVKATNQGNDSLWYALDEGPYRGLFISPLGPWSDHALPFQFLSSGEHKLRLCVRESGCAVDYLELLQQNILPDSAASLYPPPPFTPPEEHPRVLLRSKDLPALRQRLEHEENLPFWQLVQQRVSSEKCGILDPEIHQGKAGLFDSTVLNGIQCLAFYAMITGDEDCSMRAIKAMLLFLDQVAFKLDFQDITRQMGETIYSAALVYDWCYQQMSAEDKQLFIDHTENIAALMEIGCPPIRQGNITGHAGEAQLFRDLLSFGIACYDEKPVLYQVCAGRFFHLMLPPRLLYMGSGRHHQGCCYGPYRLRWEIFAALLLKAMNGTEVFPPEEVRSQLKGIIYNFLPDQSHFTNGDCFKAKNFSPTMLAISAYCHDAMAKGEFIRQQGLQYYRREPVAFLLFNQTDLLPAEREALPLSAFFSEPLGGMIARSGWEMDARADVAVVDMRGAGLFFANHQHPDAGAFQIYYRAPLAVDPGQYRRYGTDYDMLFNKQSISHNVMLIHDPDEERPRGSCNDGGQRIPNHRSEPGNLEVLLNNDYQNGRVSAHAIGPDATLPVYTHLKCDIAQAYSDKVREYTRSFVYFNTQQADAPAVLIVFDRVVASKASFRKEWIIHSYQPPLISEERLHIAFSDELFDGSLELIPLLPGAAQRQISHCPSISFGEQSLTPPQPHLPSATSIRTSISPTTEQAEDLFLNVLPIGKHPDGWQAKLLELPNAVATDIQQQFIALFARDGQLIQGTLCLELPGQRRVLLTDLTAGAWTILKNNQPWAKFQVAKDNHCLFFQADVGVYDIVPQN
jgi:heparin/heparan-sulfate lyase